MTDEISLDIDDLRAITAFAAESAATVLEIFERSYPSDSRPRDAVAAAYVFAGGGKRGKALRDTAWAALRAARESEDEAAGHAARAAMCAASAAYLHPLARSTQVRHILGASARAARAVELAAGGDPGVAAGHVDARPVVRPQGSSRYYVAFPQRQAVAEGPENCFVPSIRYFGV